VLVTLISRDETTNGQFGAPLRLEALGPAGPMDKTDLTGLYVKYFVPPCMYSTSNYFAVWTWLMLSNCSGGHSVLCNFNLTAPVAFVSSLGFGRRCTMKYFALNFFLISRNF